MHPKCMRDCTRPLDAEVSIPAEIWMLILSIVDIARYRKHAVARIEIPFSRINDSKKNCTSVYSLPTIISDKCFRLFLFFKGDLRLFWEFVHESMYLWIQTTWITPFFQDFIYLFLNLFVLILYIFQQVQNAVHGAGQVISAAGRTAFHPTGNSAPSNTVHVVPRVGTTGASTSGVMAQRNY